MLSRTETPATRAFLRLAGTEPIVIGDIVLLEVLQGASSEARAQAIEGWLRRFTLEPMLTEARPKKALAAACTV